MALVCSLSNEVPEIPVISPQGYVYEKRLVEKFIEEHGVEPMSGEALQMDQLIAMKVHAVARPRPPSATSIPAILKVLQDEWDAVMLHSFTQRQQLQTARQELSHALYQHDAACRVIARLQKEGTAAREALATLKPQASVRMPAMAVTGAPQQPAAEVAVPVEAPAEVVGMSSEVLEQLQQLASRLTAERKRRGKTLPEGLATSEELQRWHQQASHTGLHSASNPGITALDMRDSEHIVTGGNDKNATVFNKQSQQVTAVLKGHTKKVTGVIYHPREELVFSCSPDETVRIWGVQQAQCAQVIRCHSAAVTGISLHATGEFLLSASADGYWAFTDVRRGQVLAKVADEKSGGTALTSAQFHPDGLIFATGTEDAQVKIWDLKEQTNVANFPGHTGAVSSIAFSENGYFLATAAEDATVKLWDLRKLKNFKTIQLDEKYEVKSLTFDESGTYLAVAGSDVRLYLCKQWQELRVFNDHTALATAVRFGESAQFVATASLDRSLKFFGL